MPCDSPSADLCKTHKTYISVGQPVYPYHGQLCEGCLWWVDTEEDQAFKQRIAEITGKAKQSK